MNFNLHCGELHSDSSINDKNNLFESYIPKCYKVKRILISFNCFSEYSYIIAVVDCQKTANSRLTFPWYNACSITLTDFFSSHRAERPSFSIRKECQPFVVHYT